MSEFVNAYHIFETPVPSVPSAASPLKIYVVPDIADNISAVSSTTSGAVIVFFSGGNVSIFTVTENSDLLLALSSELILYT